MSLKRRHFLQVAGSTLAALGLNQLDFFNQADRYARVLAQGTPRKLALLIGINSYPDPISSLSGCLNDVKMQQMLLTYRYGFNLSDILVLSSDAAQGDLLPTRANILRAFEEHLIKQAKPGDVVVVHYSGHGSRVKDDDPIAQFCPEDNQTVGSISLNGTLVPQDGQVTRETGSTVEVPDIMGRTLFLLMKAINTDNLTVVLDSCFSGGGTRGNVMVRAARARADVSKIQVPNSDELAYQQQWLSKLSLKPGDFHRLRQAGIARGVAIGSALCNQEALDAPFENFNAGAFTYLLTRYLWQLPVTETTGAIQVNLSRSTQLLADSVKHSQSPKFYTAPGSNDEQKPFYFLPLPTQSAEAVITTVSSETIEFWLGGISTQNLQSSDTVFSLVDATGKPVLDAAGKPIDVQQQRRVEPLYGYGKLLSGQPNQIKPGLLLREKIVGLSANPTLKLGLDPSLGSDLDAVKAALQSTSWIELVEVNQQTRCDCLMGRMTRDYLKELTAADQSDLPTENTIGLFASDLVPLTDSFGNIAEPATSAVDRLKLRLKGLLVAQVLRSIAATSSSLQVSGEIFAENGRGPSVPLNNRSALAANGQLNPVIVTPQAFRAGIPIRIRLKNQEAKPLYLSSLIIKGDGSLSLLYPANWQAPESEPQIEAGKDLVVPRQEDGIQLTPGGSGSVELLILVSTTPLRNALKALQTIAGQRGITRGRLSVNSDEALPVINHLLSDIGNLSRGGSNTGDITAEAINTDDQHILDTNLMAAFSTLIEIQS